MVRGVANIGLVGLGDVAVPHLEAYAGSTSLKVVAGVEPRAERRTEIGIRFGIRTYATVGEMLDRERLDVACVLTPAAAHRAVTEEIAGRGVNVLCEKPLATKLEDARAMIAACERGGVKLGYGSSYRFLPAVARARELTREGAVGEVRLMVETLVGGRGRDGHRPLSAAHYPAGGPGGSGMGLVDHGIHPMDFMPWLVGSEVVSVFGRGNISGAAPSPEFIVMFMANGGSGHLLYDDSTYYADLPTEGIFSSGIAWNLDGSISAAQTWHAHPGSISVYGTNGALRIFHYVNKLFLTTDGGQEDVPLADVPAPGHFALQMEAFATALRAGEPPPVSGEDGLRALRVLLGAYESFQRQAVVQLT